MKSEVEAEEERVEKQHIEEYLQNPWIPFTHLLDLRFSLRENLKNLLQEREMEKLELSEEKSNRRRRILEKTYRMFPPEKQLFFKREEDSEF